MIVSSIGALDHGTSKFIGIARTLHLRKIVTVPTINHHAGSRGIDMNIANPCILLVAALQVVGGAYSAYTGDWKLAVINVGVGIANAVLSTIRG